MEDAEHDGQDGALGDGEEAGGDASVQELVC
jgi:hypothetical protein